MHAKIVVVPIAPQAQQAITCPACIERTMAGLSICMRCEDNAGWAKALNSFPEARKAAGDIYPSPNVPEAVAPAPVATVSDINEMGRPGVSAAYRTYTEAAPSSHTGQRLYAIRYARRITQVELSNACGVSVRRISDIEHGAVPSSIEVDAFMHGINALKPHNTIALVSLVGSIEVAS